MASASDWKGMLQEILDDEDANLSGWELDFVDSLDNMNENTELTDKQFTRLQDIYTKVKG